MHLYFSWKFHQIMGDFRALAHRGSVLLVLNRGLAWLTCSLYDSVQADITSSWEPSLTISSPLPPLIPSPIWVWCPSGRLDSLVLLLSCWSVPHIDCFVFFPLDGELPKDRERAWLIPGSQAPSTGLGTGKMHMDGGANSVAQRASFWSFTVWAPVFPSFDAGLAGINTRQSFHFLIKHLCKFASEHSFPSRRGWWPQPCLALA